MTKQVHRPQSLAYRDLWRCRLRTFAEFTDLNTMSNSLAISFLDLSYQRFRLRRDVLL